LTSQDHPVKYIPPKMMLS